MSLNFDVNSNLSRKKVSHYGKIVKYVNFILTVLVSFATDCTIAGQKKNSYTDPKLKF
jgi:hypothetical protein